MFGQRSVLLSALIAAVATPYFLTEEGWSKSLKQKLASVWGRQDGDDQAWSSLKESLGNLTGEPSAADFSAPAGGFELSNSVSMPASSATSPTTSGHPYTTGAQLTGPGGDLSQYLRFDLTPRWITDHWARVSTVLAETDLRGYRVPVVTGTHLHDVAGSLTYYFDPRGKMRRITLHGFTGDERPLVQFLCKNYHLCAEPSLGAGRYVARWSRDPISAMQIHNAPVVRAEVPHGRLEVLLELNWPTAHGLSPEFQRLLAPTSGPDESL